MAKKETEEVKQEQTPETAEAPKEPPKDASPEETPEAPQTPEQPEVNWEEKYNAEHDSRLRLAAEYDNFRKRTTKEKEASYGNGKADAITKLLPVYDNLERALNQPTEDAAYKKGVEMTNLHNAVMHLDSEEHDENVIAQVFQKGFKLGDKVIRFAMVQVAN